MRLLCAPLSTLKGEALRTGAGLVAGGLNGIETDEQGNVSFNAEAFLKGLLIGSAGSLAFSKGL